MSVVTCEYIRSNMSLTRGLGKSIAYIVVGGIWHKTGTDSKEI